MLYQDNGTLRGLGVSVTDSYAKTMAAVRAAKAPTARNNRLFYVCLLAIVAGALVAAVAFGV